MGRPFLLCGLSSLSLLHWLAYSFARFTEGWEWVPLRHAMARAVGQPVPGAWHQPVTYPILARHRFTVAVRLSEAVVVVTTPATASPTHTRIARSTGRQEGGSFRVHALPIRPASHVLNVTSQLTGMPLLFFVPYHDPYHTAASLIFFLFLIVVNYCPFLTFMTPSSPT